MTRFKVAIQAAIKAWVLNITSIVGVEMTSVGDVPTSDYYDMWHKIYCMTTAVLLVLAAIMWIDNYKSGRSGR